MQTTKMTQGQFIKNRKDKLRGITKVDEEVFINVIDAFRKGDLYDLSQTHQSLNGTHWYQFITQPKVISNVNPIQTNILNQILRAKTNQAFSFGELEENDLIDINELQEIFKKLVSYGSGTIVFDSYNNKWTHKFISGSSSYAKNKYTGVETFSFYEIYKKLHKSGADLYLVRKYEGLKETKELRIGGVDGQKLILTDYFPELKSEYTHKFKLFHHFTYDFNATKIIGYLNEIDANKTQISFINATGMPFVIDPELLRIEAGETNIDETTLVGTRGNKYNGAVKPSFVEGEDGMKQVIEPTFVAPDLHIKTYTEAIDNNIKDLSRYFGITPISLGYENTNNTSGKAMAQLNQLSENTKQADRKLIDMILDVFNEEFQMDIELTYSDPTDVADNFLLQHYKWMYESALISKETLRKLSFPDWSNDDWVQDDAELIKDYSNGIVPTLNR